MMIEYLRGNLLRVDGTHVVIDVGGVGYGFEAPRSTIERLPEEGAETVVHISMVVREDALELYGFATREARGAFEVFRNISGVGARTALDILSTISVREVVTAVESNNVDVLKIVPGIGPKKARRMIMELKDRLKTLLPFAVDDGKFRPGASARVAALNAEAMEGEPDLYQDAVAALQALGFKPAAASRSVALALRSLEGAEVPVAELVRLALQTGR